MLPLGLSMRWESVDPDAALSERFGFGDLTEVTDWLTAVLDRSWAIASTHCRRLVISGPNAIAWVDSDRGALVVKWSRAQDRFTKLDAATRVQHLVGTQGGPALPVATPLTSIDDQVRLRLDGPAGPLSVAVLPELSGGWLDVEDADAVHAAGATLAALHQSLRVCPADSVWTPPLAPASRTRIESTLADRDRPLPPGPTRQLRDLLTDLPDLDDRRQLVHNDFRAANILTSGSTITGLLDFDELAWDLPLNDLAKAGVYLGTRFRDWQPTPAAVRRTFLAGYESVHVLDADERRWFDALSIWQEILSIPVFKISS